VPTASGANSVASALGFRSGATPFGHDHTNTTSPQPSSKEDISIWQKSGHFYLALTGGGFPHKQNLAFDTNNNYPLPNHHVSKLHRAASLPQSPIFHEN
jgi:hypothetical protein